MSVYLCLYYFFVLVFFFSDGFWTFFSSGFCTNWVAFFPHRFDNQLPIVNSVHKLCWSGFEMFTTTNTLTANVSNRFCNRFTCAHMWLNSKTHFTRADLHNLFAIKRRTINKKEIPFKHSVIKNCPLDIVLNFLVRQILFFLSFFFLLLAVLSRKHSVRFKHVIETDYCVRPQVAL